MTDGQKSVTRTVGIFTLPVSFWCVSVRVFIVTGH